MYRVIVLYEEEPEAASYAEHVEVRAIASRTASFGTERVTGAPMGEPKHAYYAEWDFADKAAFDAAVRSEEFMASGKDAYKRGFQTPGVDFVELS